MDKTKKKTISLIGIPFDEKSSFLKGCAKAPPLIRESLNSYAINSFAENGVDIRDENIIDRGDYSVKELSEVVNIADEFLRKGDSILALGGDHSITYPLVKACSGYYSGIEILHIDAHPDLYDELEGDRLSHACPFARIMEEKLAARLVQVGIRTINTHQREQAEKFGVEIIAMKEFSVSDVPDFSNPVYISVDLDGIDPAFAPGVSHHEPGGLSSRQVVDIIGNINVPVIGGDIVEYNPGRDVSGITSALAAKLVKEILSKMVVNI
ncbi:MAG: agmatinase [Candidatus Aminicenantes bacterium]|nr:agmatinase [Candidatus Aminicenantes bacterium]